MQTDQVGKVVGGKSGGIFNEILIEEFKAAAKEHVERIAFVYLDGNLFEDKMRSLGLYGGKERLPSIAFNTRDHAQIPFPEELPINKDTLLQFCADFISGKLRSPEDSKAMARKALQAAIPINQKNKAVRKERKTVPESTRGVSEQFGDCRVLFSHANGTAVMTYCAFFSGRGWSRGRFGCRTTHVEEFRGVYSQ